MDKTSKYEVFFIPKIRLYPLRTIKTIIPSPDLTTHGYGIERAEKAALELVTLWIQEKSENNEPVHQENESYFSRLEIINALCHASRRYSCCYFSKNIEAGTAF